MFLKQGTVSSLEEEIVRIISKILDTLNEKIEIYMEI